MSLIYIALGIGAGFLLLMVAMRFAIQYKAAALKGKPVPALSSKIDAVVRKGNPALFYFYSPACGACAAMTPNVKALANKRNDVFAVDVSTDMDIARKLGVMATPTLVVVQNTHIADVLIGPQPPNDIERLIP